MTDFRNRLTKEVVNQINAEIIRKEIRKLPPRKRTQVSSDTTCLEANIEFPTDVRLLIKVYKKLVKVACSTRKNAKDILIRGKNNIKNKINAFNKNRRHKKDEISQIKNELINFTEILHIKIKDKAKVLTEKQNKLLQNAMNIVKQQKTMLEMETNKIKSRIISFHEQDLRPIYRGKLIKSIEFGKKSSIMVIGQALVIPGECTYDNVSDSKLPEKDIRRFKEVTGRNIKEYTADRGMHSPKNHQLMKDHGITDGIAYRGRIPNKAKNKISTKTKKRLNNQRQPVEGKFGTLKTRYGCGRIPYKATNTEIRLGFGSIMHNLNWGIRH